MKIQEQDRFHGPALMQIVEHDSFKALNKADDQYGHYLVNKDTRLWFKYATAKNAPWQFTFQADDLRALEKDMELQGDTHVVLVCGNHSICCMSGDEIQSLVELCSSGSQWVKVDAPEGKQMRVTGSLNNRTPALVPHNKFPNCIF